MTRMAERKILFLYVALLFGSTLVVGDDQTCSAEDGSCQEKCVDRHGQCYAWAWHGECDVNAAYMKKNCPWSCEFCNATSPIHFEDEGCENLHPKCEEWAASGECIANPGYMLSACKLSCLQCLNTTKMRELGVDEEMILKTVRYVKSNPGKDQDQGSDKEQEKVKAIQKQIYVYALHNVTMMPLNERRSCKHGYSSCVFWASSGECQANIPFMMQSCPLACQFCGHRRDQYERCYGKRNRDAEPLLEEGDLYKLFQKLKGNEKVDLVSTMPVKEQDDPWVLKWDDFLTVQEADQLLDLIKGREWNPSAEVRREGTHTTLSPARRQSKSAYCNDCQDKVLQKLQKSLRDVLDAPSTALEPLEFVHYNYLQSFAMHHDFSIHDTWLPAGPRVLSIFLCLSDVEKGGAYGFPDLDWLLIPPKKGQLLIWPNVLSSDPNKRNSVMLSEALPVTKGDKYGVQTWVRMYDYRKAAEMDCV